MKNRHGLILRQETDSPLIPFNAAGQASEAHAFFRPILLDARRQRVFSLAILATYMTLFLLCLGKPQKYSIRVFPPRTNSKLREIQRTVTPLALVPPRGRKKTRRECGALRQAKVASTVAEGPQEKEAGLVTVIHDDPNQELSPVLERFGGELAFGSGPDENFFQFKFRSSDWQPMDTEIGQFRFDAKFLVIRLKPGRWNFVEELRARHSIPLNCRAYAMFPADAVDRELQKQVDSELRPSGREPTKIEITWSAASPIGFVLAILESRKTP